MKLRHGILLALVLMSLPAMAERVISVHDGDTFTLESGQRVRLSGIDAPEIGQPFSEESRDYLQRLVKNRDVSLDCQGRSYNRIVCHAFVVGLDIQKELVGWGLAYDYKRYSGGAYANAEQFARKMRRGVWQVPEGGIKPWDYRRASRQGRNAAPAEQSVPPAQE